MDNYEKRNRIAEALNIREMKKIELSEKTGIHKATISNWINQKYQPKQKSLIIMAKVLEVSELWLAGYDVAMERPLEQKKMDNLAETIHLMRGNDKYVEVMSYMTKLDDTQLEIVLSMLKGLSNN